MTSNATIAYAANLKASLERTRDELKAVIGLLMDDDSEASRTAAARLHRTVGAITEDLRG